jgi:L-threonylcarbamoyladenylate synthase
MGKSRLSAANEGLIARAADIIRRGGLVIVPTETFYALAADPFQEAAVRKIFVAKSRDASKPLPLIASSRTAVSEVVVAPDQWIDALMDAFWPGSLTMLLWPNRAVSRLISGRSGKIGVRVPPRCAAQALAEACGGWICATSANLAGYPSADRVAMIAPEVREAAGLVMDLGPTPGGKPSTVVEPDDEGIRIIREGVVRTSELKAFARQWGRKVWR